MYPILRVGDSLVPSTRKASDGIPTLPRERHRGIEWSFCESALPKGCIDSLCDAPMVRAPCLQGYRSVGPAFLCGTLGTAPPFGVTSDVFRRPCHLTLAVASGTRRPRFAVDGENSSMSRYVQAAALKSKSRPNGFSLQVQCPGCKNSLGDLPHVEPHQPFVVTCSSCDFELKAVNGIWRALLPTRAAYFERFMANYQAVRAAEGRGSECLDYYLSLPYRDLTGANQAQWSIRAQTFRYLERKILPQLEALAVLDLGAGNGWLSYRLVQRGHRAAAVDLMTDCRDGLGAAQQFGQVLLQLFLRIQAELDNLPIANDEFDVAIFNHKTAAPGPSMAVTRL